MVIEFRAVIQYENRGKCIACAPSPWKLSVPRDNQNFNDNLIRKQRKYAPPARAAPPAGGDRLPAVAVSDVYSSDVCSNPSSIRNHHLVYALTHFIFVRPTSIRTPAALEFSFL